MKINRVLEIQKDLKSLSYPIRAEICRKFFQTKKGQYGEGDIFIGVTVPDARKVAKKYGDLNFSEIKKLLHSKIHEDRFVALIILDNQFKKGNNKLQEDIVNLYLSETRYINNWDLVDTSASYILGAFLENKKRDILYKLVKSKSLWERRIAIVSTHYFIKRGEVEDTLKISKILLSDGHHLIHKAVGWMLREVGKVNHGALVKFLKENYDKIPRTTLRYSIERFPEEFRRYYLKKQIL